MEVRCHTSSTADPVLAVADSEGGINLVRWSTSEVLLPYTRQKHSPNALKRQATQLQKIACGSVKTLCLSLDWDNRRFPRYATGCLGINPPIHSGMQLLRVFNRLTIRWLSLAYPTPGWNHDHRRELACSRLRTMDSSVELLGRERTFLR